MVLRIGLLIFFLIGGLLSALSLADAKDFYPYFKKEKVVSIEVTKPEDTKIDTATIKAQSGKCFQFQMEKGKVLNWRRCNEPTWFVAE
jgi:cytochrome oxidase Cu insertion factor (SCO1/SenC/PrrC family)